MDFDFSELKHRVEALDAAIARSNQQPIISGKALAQDILDGLAPYLKGISAESPKTLKDDMGLLYSKAIELTPFWSVPKYVKGMFLMATENFKGATECFRGAYEISQDPDIKSWPHLMETPVNAALLILMGECVTRSGEDKDGEGERFRLAGRQMNLRVTGSESLFQPPTLK